MGHEAWKQAFESLPTQSFQCGHLLCVVIHICSSYLYVHKSHCALYLENIFHLPAYFKWKWRLFEQTKQGQSHLVKRWRKLSCAELYCTIFLHLLCSAVYVDYNFSEGQRCLKTQIRACCFGLLTVHREKLHYTHSEVATQLQCQSE